MISLKNAFSSLYNYLNPVKVETPKASIAEQVTALISKGYKIKIKHRRAYTNHPDCLTRYEYESLYKEPKDYSTHVMNTGGNTEVEIIFPDGRFVRAFANCSWQDQFSRKEGRERAIERCLSAM